MVRIPTGSFKTLYVKPAAGAHDGEKKKEEKFSLEKADLLLKSTGQYRSFADLRRKNDTAASEAAKLVLERHSMLDNAEKGGETDKKRFDELTSKIASYGILLYDSSHFQFHETAQIQPIQASSSENEELILQMVHKDHILSNGLLAFRKNNNTFYPLKAISSLIGFKGINKNGGNYQYEDGNIDLESMLFSKGKQITHLSKDDFVKDKDDLYLRDSLVENFLGIDLDLDYSNMRISLSSKGDLPYMDRIRRQNSEVFKYDNRAKSLFLPYLDNDYGLIDYPIADIHYNLGKKSDEKDLSYDYSLKARGDLLRTSTRFYIQGNDDNSPERIELMAERVNPGERKSSMDVNRVAAGDIRHDSFSVFNSTDSEQGILIQGKDLSRNSEFDSTEFRGNLQKGWDVELYRNNVLIGKAASDDKGEFLFDDIPLYYGDNRFRLVYYGPNGEKNEEEKILNVGQSMEKPGKFSYNFALSEKNRKTLPYTDPELNDSGKLRFSSSITAGLTDRLSMEAGVRSEEVLSERKNYSTAGLIGSLGGVLLKGDIATDHEGGKSGLVSAQAKLGDFHVRAKHIKYDDFFLDGMNENDPERSRSEASVSGLLFEESRLPVSFTLRDIYTDRENSDSNILSLREGITKKDYGIYNYNQWQKDDSTGTDEITGSLYQYFNIKDNRLRSGLDYDLTKGIDLKKVTLSDEISLKDNLSMNLEGRYDFDQGNYGFESSLTYDSGKYKITPRFSKNEDGSYEFWTGVSLSIGVNPHTEKLDLSSYDRSSYGEVSALVFKDKNNNGIQDKGEPPIPDVRVESFRTGRFSISDKEGIASIKRIQPYGKEEIYINETSIPDPDLVSAERGRSLYPRPGHIESITFPVYSSSEFEGKLFFKDEKGKVDILPYEKIIVSSEDGSVKKEAVSEYDGYFLMDRLPPGKYVLRVKDEDRGFDFTKKIELSSKDTEENSGIKNIVISASFNKSEKISETASDKGSSVKSVSSRVLYENGKWVSGNVDKTLPDRSFLLYENGEWVYGEKPSGRGIHVASFQNLSNAEKFVEKNMSSAGEDAVIKKVDLGSSGIWYRVLYGRFEDDEAALDAKGKMASLFGYADIINFDS